MSQTESDLSPLSLRQLPPLADDETTQLLFRVLSWFRGDQRVGRLQSTTTASVVQQLNIEPPDTTEEWEIFSIWIFDSAAIDVGDTVQTEMVDVVANYDVMLDSGLLQNVGVGSASAVNGRLFPNKDTTATSQKVSLQALTAGYIVKRRDNKTPWLRMVVYYKATATVGTRVINVAFIYRRRRMV